MRFQLENSPALALLHKRHASVLVSFFQKVFRDSNIPEVPEERLEGRWEVFIEEDVVLSDWEGETPTNTAKFLPGGMVQKQVAGSALQREGWNLPLPPYGAYRTGAPFCRATPDSEPPHVHRD